VGSLRKEHLVTYNKIIMRKLYALLAGFILSLASNTNADAKNVSPDVANFTFTVVTPNNNVLFTNTSTIGSEPGIRRAYWHFGDGSIQMTGPLENTRHHYQVAGTYTVCLKIYRYRPNMADSILSAQVCKTVVIQTACTAGFVTLNVAANPLLKYFVAQPSHNQHKKPVRVCWRFGDGRDTCINYPAGYNGAYGVSHLYGQPGNYNVCVNILYDGGCRAEECRQVEVIVPDSCRADFVRLPVTPHNNPRSVVFKALPWHNNNKKPARICWQFGDGRDTCINYTNSYTGQYTVNHTYRNTGLYEVCVKILYFGGCEARKCKPIQVGRPDSCRADFERIPSPNADPRRAYFKALPWHNNNKKPQTICWRFGDGQDTCINYPANYSGQYVVTHNYQHRGLYEVCVKIEYFGGCEARKCKEIQIGERDSCSADFERGPNPGTSPLTVGLKALPWNNNNRKPSRVCWNFGDGRDTCINYPENYTGLYNVVHTYPHPGQYEVCVKIFYYGACEARKCKTIVVPPPPVNCTVRLFEITPSITSLVRGFLAVPHSDSARRPERVCWYFGDGEDTCIMINPQQPIPNLFIRHTYPAPGIYRACVKVRFRGGCIAEDCREVIIRPASNLCGGYMTDSLSGPRTFKFKGFSIHNPNDEVLSYRWTFGDGTSALGREVTHTYNHGGNYEVCLYIKTRLGCETRICKTVRVPGNNQPALQLAPNPVINVLNVAFSATHTEQVNIKILNAMGNQVSTSVRNVNVGPNNWNHDLSNMMPGVYSYIVQSPNQLASALFIKL
jgi:PKD repeat protein